MGKLARVAKRESVGLHYMHEMASLFTSSGSRLLTFQRLFNVNRNPCPLFRAAEDEKATFVNERQK